MLGAKWPRQVVTAKAAIDPTRTMALMGSAGTIGRRSSSDKMASRSWGGSMRRRDFIVAIASTVSGWPAVAHAQQSALPIVALINS